MPMRANQLPSTWTLNQATPMPDDHRGLHDADGEAHEDLADEQLPAGQWRGAQAAQHAVLAQRDDGGRGAEEAELHQRHRQDARDEEGDVGEVVRLDRLLGDAQLRNRVQILRGEAGGDALHNAKLDLSR